MKTEGAVELFPVIKDFDAIKDGRLGGGVGGGVGGELAAIHEFAFEAE